MCPKHVPQVSIIECILHLNSLMYSNQTISIHQFTNKRGKHHHGHGEAGEAFFYDWKQHDHCECQAQSPQHFVLGTRVTK